MGEWWAVTCEYRLINSWIADTMELLTRYINRSRVRAISARMSLCSALPQAQVSICEKDNQVVQIMMKTIIDGSRCWMDNTLQWSSMEGQQLVDCEYGNFTVICSLLCISDVLAASIGDRERRTVTTPFWEWASTIPWFASWILYVLIRCRHQYIRYWLPLLGKTTATFSLPHLQNEPQRRVYDY